MSQKLFLNDLNSVYGDLEIIIIRRLFRAGDILIETQTY